MTSRIIVQGRLFNGKCCRLWNGNAFSFSPRGGTRGQGLPFAQLYVAFSLPVLFPLSLTIEIAIARLASYTLPIVSLQTMRAETFAWIQKSGHAQGGIASAWIHDSTPRCLTLNQHMAADMLELMDTACIPECTKLITTETSVSPLPRHQVSTQAQRAPEFVPPQIALGCQHLYP